MTKFAGGVFPSLAIALVLLVPAVRADPTVTSSGQGSVEVVWEFENPANYTASDVEMQGGFASLRRTPGWSNDTTQSDFAVYTSTANIDLASRPGDVVLASPTTSMNATYVSRVIGSGQAVRWRSIAWTPSSSENFSDEFGGSSLAPKWSWYNPPLSYSVGSPLPGYLTFASRTNTEFWNTAHSGQFLYQTITGDFEIETRISASFTAANQKAGILTMDPSDPNNWFAFYRFRSGGVVQLQAVLTVFGTTYAGPPITANPDYLRLTRRGNVAETRYSSDGTNWAVYQITTVPIALPAFRVGVMGADGLSGTPITLNLDYVRFSFADANPRVQVETRTGNTTMTSDPSWTPWSTPYPDNSSSPIDRRSAYLQYRIRLFTSSVYVRPLVGDVNLAWESRASTGEVTTEEFSSGTTLMWDLLALDAIPQGGTVQVSSSIDGAAWQPVQPGGLNLTVNRTVRLRLTLSTPDPSISPTVGAVRAGLRLPPSPPSPFPFWLLLLPLALFPAWLLVTRLLRGPFKATDVFLIHADGRLVLHEGGRHILIRDEIAASGMFTLVTRFVKDSFGGTGGVGGELKSLQVDERDVSIAKGGYLFLALVAHGPRPKHLESSMSDFLRTIEQAHRPALEAWNGLGEGLGDLRGQLHWFLRKGHRRAHPILPGRRYAT